MIFPQEVFQMLLVSNAWFTLLSIDDAFGRQLWISKKKVSIDLRFSELESNSQNRNPVILNTMQKFIFVVVVAVAYVH